MIARLHLALDRKDDLIRPEGSDPRLVAKSRPASRRRMIGQLDETMRLREFCGSQWCFVVLCRDKCNDVPAAVV